MINLEHLGIILVLTFVSYWFFTKLRLPSPAILGPMLFIGAFQVLGGGIAQLPTFFMDCFQIIIGLFVGAKVNRSTIGDIRRIWGPSLIIAVYTLASTGLATLLILGFTSDYATALFSAAPGGITEMAVMAIAYDADIPIVSTFQFVRLLVILGIVPFIARGLKDKGSLPVEPEKDASPKSYSQRGLSFKRIILYAAGITGGVIFITAGFPGGGIIGAMIALGTANLISGEAYVFPKKVMRIALIGVGMTIGLEFSPLMIARIQEMLLPIVVFSIAVVLGNLLVGWIIRYFTHWDSITCILSSAPGGLSQMIALGEEMRADVLKISILQTVRALTIIISIPVIAALII